MTTLAPIPIFRDRQFYVPRFELFVGDRPERGSLLHDVMQVTYKDNLDSIDTFELTINNWDAEKRRFKHHDSTMLNPGQRLRLHMGYLDDKGGLKSMLQGVITEMTPTFPAAGQPTLKVVGQNVLHDFCKEPRNDSYKGTDATVSRVAARICQRVDVVFRNDSSHRANEVVHNHLIQSNQHDIVFLMELARQEGYELVVEEPAAPGGKTILRFLHIGEVVRKVYELRYGSTLTEFQPILSTSKQVNSVIVNGWDIAKGEDFHVEVDQDGIDSKQRLKGKMLPGMKNPVEDRKAVLTERAPHDRQSARAMAAAKLASINQELVKATGSVVGLPELRTGSQVYLWGLGRRFSGRYFITSSTHTISMSGYITQFDCRLEELESDPLGER